MNRIVLVLAGICGVASVQGEELDYRVTDPELKVVKFDSSPDDSFLSVRVDTEGRIFVGGRKTLSVYDLDATGQYRPRHRLFEFPDHTWINDIEIRGDDLYVVTVSAVYRLPGARVRRDGLAIERLLWGVPNGHVHQCFHACAWGSDGALYVSMGDPLWYYGDFQRPDHWGYWTMFFRPTAGATEKTVTVRGALWATVPYHGVGAVFRLNPDGTGLQSWARGLRNPCGLCFDGSGNLLTNDNDHEGIPSLYAPGRLLQITEGAYYSWPRGWLRSKTPDRADLWPSLNEEMGRAVPVLQTVYDEPDLPARYRNSLLVARWCRRQVAYFPLQPSGDGLVAQEHVLLEGRDQARPVGVCVGRGGRIFVTICYMAQNEGSPTYRSDLAVITRKDDPAEMPFTPRSLPQTSVRDLQEAVRGDSLVARQTAIQELHRRQVPVKVEDSRVAVPAAFESVTRLRETLRSDRAAVRDALRSMNLQSRAGLLACTRLGDADVPEFVEMLLDESQPALRLAGVLAAGFALTIPPVHAELPEAAPLAPQQKEEANLILFADEAEPLDLRTLGRVGNYTRAEHWKALPHTEREDRWFQMLLERLEDPDDKVRLQAAHFLSVLNDPRCEPRIAAVTADVQDRRLNLARIEHLKPTLWMLGPVPDAEGFATAHAVEQGPVDLSAKYEIGGKSYAWTLTRTTSPDRPLYDFRTLFGSAPHSSVYSSFRFESPTAQRMQLLVGSEDGVRIWHNGRKVFENDVVRPLIQLDDVVPLDLQPGTNEILVRVRLRQGFGGQYFHYRHLGGVQLTIPEKPDGLTLAERLKSAGTTQPVDPRFLEVDWRQAAASGDIARGRKLFSAESLGCAKCHAATPTQAGGGGPSLADSGRRFTVPYLVESVLAPSQVISPVFKSTILETTDGMVLTGLVIAETAEKLELLQLDTRRITVMKSRIETRKTGDTSAMPAGLVKTPEELRDVLAYLLSNPAE